MALGLDFLENVAVYRRCPVAMSGCELQYSSTLWQRDADVLFMQLTAVGISVQQRPQPTGVHCDRWYEPGLGEHLCSLYAPIAT